MGETEEQSANPAPAETTSTETTSQPTPLTDELAAKIKKQVEFYFSNSNYPTDSFLQDTAKNNPDGYIPLATIATFNRMKSLTNDINHVVQALENSDVVVLNEDKTLIKRKHPLPEGLHPEERTVHVTGAKGGNLEEFLDFFAEFGKINAVRILRDKAKKPNGSLLVEFDVKEEADAFLAKENVTFHDQVLTISKEIPKNVKSARESVLKKRKAPEPKEPKEFVYDKGVVVEFKGTSENTSRDDVRKYFSAAGDVKFVEFFKEEKQGFVRFATQDEAKAALALTEALDGVTLQITPVEGLAEELYYKRAQESQQNAKGGRGGRGGGRGRGGRSRGRGGRGGGGKRKKTE